MEKLRTERDISILLIEHDMKVVMNVSDHITVLDGGEKIAAGSPQEVRANPRVSRPISGARHERRQRRDPCPRGRGHPHVLRFDRGAQGAISLTVNDGEIVTLIGSNGAGKSTTLRSISGLTRPRPARCTFRGRRDRRAAGYQVAEPGIAQSPEGRHVFPRMTVLENLEMGAFTRNDSNIPDDIDRVYELFPRLKERATQKAGTMSGGEQQMLAIGRALMARPGLLLLDEPSLGLAPVVVVDLRIDPRAQRDAGVTILLVEQNANYALDVSKRGYVLETGKVALSNDSESLRNDPEVMKAYLGT